MSPPGSWKPSVDRWGRFEALLAEEERLLVVVDRRVQALHPAVARALASKDHTVIAVTAGEALKRLDTLERVSRRIAHAARASTLVAIGGGTVGDFATVLAHTFKRGVRRFIQVPTTFLAAVDSSVGGKGALNVAGAKNVLGVFHAADEAWLCPAVWTTLSDAQRNEGRVEALKMALTLDARAFARWERNGAPADEALIREARALKTSVVNDDPYEATGRRAVLNFGHTFGHVIESLSDFRVRHGLAVGLGMLVALDLGVQLGLTPRALAERVERMLPVRRSQLNRFLKPALTARVRGLLQMDKKAGWVIVERPGQVRIVPFAELPWPPTR